MELSRHEPIENKRGRKSIGARAGAHRGKSKQTGRTGESGQSMKGSSLDSFHFSAGMNIFKVRSQGERTDDNTFEKSG